MNRFHTLKASAPAILYHDGHCPFCQAEVRWLEKHPRGDRIQLIDIQKTPTPEGVSFETLMGKLHVRDADQRWYLGMDASRALYAVLGYRKLVWISCLPVIRLIMDIGYRVFARYRVRLGRWWDKRGDKASMNR